MGESWVVALFPSTTPDNACPRCLRRFHPENIGHLSSRLSTPLFTPCTPAGVIKLIDSSKSTGLLGRSHQLACSNGLTHYQPLLLQTTLSASAGVKIAGSNAVVLGRSDIVGTPVCALLRRRDATVTQCHSRTQGLETIVRSVVLFRSLFGGLHKDKADAMDDAFNAVSGV